MGRKPNRVTVETPPYLSYRTFRNFLDALRITVPTRIDRSVLASMSGSNQVLLLSAVRYLHLTNEHGVPTPDLHRLATAEGGERQQLWKRILTSAYADLFGSKMDLERTTMQELSEAFQRRGVSSPDTIRKCVTFLSLAAKDAGLKLSPHVRPYAGKRKIRVSSGETEPRSLSQSTAASTVSDALVTERLLAMFPKYDPDWSAEQRKNWIQDYRSVVQTWKDELGIKDASENHSD